MVIKKLSKKLWIYIILVCISIIPLIISLIKGWNIAAIIAAIILIISLLLGINEWKACESIKNCNGMVADTTNNVIIMTKNIKDVGQPVGANYVK